MSVNIQLSSTLTYAFVALNSERFVCKFCTYKEKYIKCGNIKINKLPTGTSNGIKNNKKNHSHTSYIC